MDQKYLNLQAAFADPEIDDFMKEIAAESYLADRFEWRKWMEEIPFIKWPADWAVKAIPPFGKAVIRYRVKLPCGSEVSIYLDCYDNLGVVGKPYWEVYPYQGDCARVFMNDTDELIEVIGKSGEKR